MHLTSSSLKLLQTVNKTVKYCYKNYDTRQQERLNIFIYKIYKQLGHACSSYNNKENINPEIRYIKNYTLEKKPFMWNSNYFPENIKTYILRETNSEIIYNFNINERLISLHIFNYDGEKDTDIYVKMIYLWLYIAGLYVDKNCSKKIKIYLYLTHFKKEIERENTILAPKNINTAYTTSGCNNYGEIIIYRKEEWFKVFIHETFHNLGLDFSHKNIANLKDRMREVFKIGSDYNIFETYCETWARIMNCLMTSFLLLDNKKNSQEYLEYCNIFLQCERIFSLKQSKKMLRHYNINFEELYDSKKSLQFKEETNVFAYYVLTGALMNNYLSFIDWCFNNNNNNYFKFNIKPKNIMLFGEFIIRLMNELRRDDTLECIYKHCVKTGNFARMSLIEL